MGAIAFIGSVAWPLLKGVMPWGGPKTTLAIIGVLLAVVVIGGPAGAVWLHMHGLKREAVRMADAACELRISESAQASAHTMASLLETIKTGEDAIEEPKTSAEEVALCRKSKFCRERAK